jgi:hypothetical protein
MHPLPENLSKRLLYILHLGLTELRNCALAARQEQGADLADVLEILPRYVEHCNEEEMDLLRFVLKTYQDKYPDRPFDFLDYLERRDPPERY